MVITLLPVPQAAKIARVFVEHKLRVLGHPDLVADALKVTSEIVTNAYRHVHGATEFKLGLCENDGRPLLELWDPSREVPIKKEVPLNAVDDLVSLGKGIHIIESLAARWGYRHLPPDQGGGKIVWALLR